MTLEVDSVKFNQTPFDFMANKSNRQIDILEETNKILLANPGFSNTAYIECIACKSKFPANSNPLYNCPKCHDILDVKYKFPKNLDPQALKALWKLRRTSIKPEDRSGVWRFREIMPFCDNPKNVVTMNEGNTPLLNVPLCAKYAGLPKLLVKHQGFNPTGSFKDPGMSAAITQAKILGAKAVACSSTGNTSASEAAYARRAGMLPIVLIPEGQISFGKLSQSLDYGALTIQVGGDFDKAMDLIMKVAPLLNVYVVNSINPFRIEGQKTMVLELLEQLDWQVPDRIVVPGGNLGHASSIGKALRELKSLGFIKKLPKITVVQAKGANPLYKAVTSKHPDNLIAVHAQTLATAIKIGNPISWKKAMDGIKATDGWVTQVTEQEIADAKAIIGRDGIGCEPASAVTVAGLKKIVKEGTDVVFNKKEIVVAILTGHILKDPDYTVRYHRGELYEEFITETKVIRKKGPIKSNFANKPILVEADEEKLKKIISTALKTF